MQNLTVMSPEDLNGAVIRSPSTLNFMLPNKSDKATERIHIPIDQAMELIVAGAAAKSTVK